MYKKSSFAKHPIFFIGAAKSGTTSLWMFLKQHPDIYMPQTSATKEPSFSVIYTYDTCIYSLMQKKKEGCREASTPI